LNQKLLKIRNFTELSAHCHLPKLKGCSEYLRSCPETFRSKFDLNLLT